MSLKVQLGPHFASPNALAGAAVAGAAGLAAGAQPTAERTTIIASTTLRILVVFI
jgi:hypothetical protein